MLSLLTCAANPRDRVAGVAGLRYRRETAGMCLYRLGEPSRILLIGVQSPLRARAQAWTRVALWPAEMDAWIGAVGVDGSAIARDCHTAGIALSATDIVLDGMRVKQRLRGGETAFSRRRAIQ
ncbi:hypothetical protein [Streptomyces sp. NBC_00557]|uniref:hypothetical protein n=1 Tax=Streptomyces sp. NBC_00557 TaxID=2975776 RepID=UPI002E80D5E3|nr:hypothetical protein [Streptomyces sp. NBC_00557]WUC32747.1 hypothetical protein OG956_00130 [Streptomyces sp. NBC_00557]